MARKRFEDMTADERSAALADLLAELDEVRQSRDAYQRTLRKVLTALTVSSNSGDTWGDGEADPADLIEHLREAERIKRRESGEHLQESDRRKYGDDAPTRAVIAWPEDDDGAQMPTEDTSAAPEAKRDPLPVNSLERVGPVFDRALAEIDEVPDLTQLERFSLAVVRVIPNAWKAGAGPDVIDIEEDFELDDRTWLILAFVARGQIQQWPVLRQLLGPDYAKAKRITGTQMRKTYASARKKMKRYQLKKNKQNQKN